MTIKLCFYAISFMISAFIVSGMNLNRLFKENHVWEFRFFVAFLMIAMSYIFTSFLYDVLVMINYSL